MADYINSDRQRYTALSDHASKHSTPLMTEDKYHAIAKAIASDPNPNARAQLTAYDKAAKAPEFSHAAYLHKNPELSETLGRVGRTSGAAVENILDVHNDQKRAPNDRLGNKYAASVEGRPTLTAEAREASGRIRQAEMAEARAARPHAHTPEPHQANTPRGFGGNMAVKAVFGVGAAAAAAASSAADGNSPAQVASAAGNAAVNTLPVIGPLREGRPAEAMAQVVTGVLLAGATVAAPISGGGSFAVASGIEEVVRRTAQKAGLDVDDAMTTAMIKTVGETIQRNPLPAGVIRTNAEYLRQQENLLKDAGLGEQKPANGRTASPAELLRNPETRHGYMATLMESGATHRVEAAEKFVEMENRRVAKLQPYTDRLSAELAASAKAPARTDQDIPDHVKAMAMQALNAIKKGASEPSTDTLGPPQQRTKATGRSV